MRYPGVEGYVFHTIREQIRLSDYGLKSWSKYSGKAYDETLEQYQEYKSFLKMRLKKGDIYEKVKVIDEVLVDTSDVSQRSEDLHDGISTPQVGNQIGLW